MANRLEITLSDEQWDRLDGARGHEPRASFVKRALESALGNHNGELEGSGRAITPAVASREVGRGAEPEARVVPASSRTSARRKPSVRETWAR